MKRNQYTGNFDIVHITHGSHVTSCMRLQAKNGIQRIQIIDPDDPTRVLVDFVVYIDRSNNFSFKRVMLIIAGNSRN